MAQFKIDLFDTKINKRIHDPNGLSYKNNLLTCITKKICYSLSSFIFSGHFSGKVQVQYGNDVTVIF